jgi:hypothetical protein
MIIITAEEFLEDFDYGNQELGTDINYPMIERCMVEFAKLHVAAALHEASDKAEMVLFETYPLTNIK